MSLEDRLGRILSNLLVAGMMTCLAATIVQFGARLAPGWQGNYLLVVAFLVALEALYAKRAVGRLSFPSRQWLIYRVSEWVFLLVVLKLLVYLLRGIDRLWLDLPRWQENFFPNFFSGEYLAAAVVMILVWSVTGGFADELIELESGERRLKVERLAGVRSDRPAAHQHVAERIFAVGGLMIVLTGLVRMDLAQVGYTGRLESLPHPGPPSAAVGEALNIILFFLLGLLLLSQGQLSILRANWSWQRIEVAPDLAPAWAVLSVLFLGGMVILASLLPTSYSLGLLATLGYVVQWVLVLLSILALILLTLLYLLFALLARLLGMAEPARPTLQPPEITSPLLVPTGGGPLWIEVLRSVVFWTIFFAVIGYSVYHFLKQRQDLVGMLVRLPGVGWLVVVWQWLRWRLGHWQAQRRQARKPAPRGAVTAGRPAWRFIRLGRLSPRELVLYFYLATLRRAAQGGLPRRPGQTPFEYAVDLRQAVPEAGSDVEPLTQAFVEARYSQHPVVRSQADAVRRHWERLKRLLVRRRRDPGVER